MLYSIQVTNIEGRVNVVKVLRQLIPGLPLVDAKNYIWGKEIVNFGAIRRERNPEKYVGDYLFTQAELDHVVYELAGLATLVTDRLPEGVESLRRARVEQIFKAGFEAGIATDLDENEAWEQFEQNFDFANGI